MRAWLLIVTATLHYTVEIGMVLIQRSSLRCGLYINRYVMYMCIMYNRYVM